jgi:hypothetical protein
MRGNVSIKLDVHGLPKMFWTMTGLYDDPTDVALVLPTLTNWQDPQPANFVNTPTFTINGYAAKMRNFELNRGSQVVYRELVNANSIEIRSHNPMITTQIEAEPMATLNPNVLAKNQTAFGINLVHGVGANRIVTLAAPNCRMMRKEGLTEVDKGLEWPLKITPLPTIGNDDFTITLT